MICIFSSNNITVIPLPSIFVVILDKEDNFCDFHFALPTAKPLLEMDIF